MDLLPTKTDMQLFTLCAQFLFVYMTVAFMLAMWRKRNDIADTAWGLGFVIIAWLSLFSQETVTPRMLLIATLVTLWGLRLALHVHGRNRGKGEDSRYRKWREEWGSRFAIRSYFQVFLFQGLLLYIVAMPVMWTGAFDRSATLTVLDYVGALVWIIGFYWETLADHQLRTFVSQPANQGRLMTSGLWRYSRHPNYFGEVTQWWGVWLIAVSAPLGLATVISPAAITFLILRVSGIPMLEEKYAGRPDFEAYKARTSVFFPWPPRP